MTDSQANLDKIWKSALKVIRDEVPVASFQAWIKSACLVNLDGNKAHIEVRNEFSRNLLIQNYYKSISKGLETALGKPAELIINVNSRLQNEDYIPSLSSLDEEITYSLPSNLRNNSTDRPEPIQANNPHSSDYFSQNLKSNQNTVNQSALSQNATPYSGSYSSSYASGLNPKFTFDNFIVGSHNQFCHAAALAIGERCNNNSYNPFFVYGDVGLGKTHIMQAIGNYMQRKNPQARILYITAEKFLNDLISNMRKSKMNEFRSKYRTLDLLLIDDIQFIEGKETTQEEFFHTFNEIKDHGGQIVLTSDRQPKDIPKLEPRLRSRFEGGLIADIQPPTYETRLAILSRKADELRMKLNPEIADLLALAFPENVRRLDGALTKIQAYSSFTGKTLTIELVEQIMQISAQVIKEKGDSSFLQVSQDNDQVKPSGQQSKAAFENKTNKESEGKSERKIDSNSQEIISKTITLVASKLNISPKQILSRDNSAEVKNARQLCMNIVRSLGITLGEISSTFDRGNSAILNSCRRISKEAETDQKLKGIILEIEEEVKKSTIALIPSST